METGCRSPVLWRRGSAARTGKRKTRESARWLWPLFAPVGLGLGIAGGESWADPAIVSPNGLPVQVNPTFPEPGLPAFSFPQGGLSDTGGVAGAVTTGGGSGSGTDSASLGSYSGTGSGVAGAIVATGYADMLGQSVGTGQCVALAQATSDIGYTSTWSPGAQVEGDTDIAVGTVIATFGSDGTYTNTYGQSHTAIYLGQDSSGIYVEDQWLGHAASNACHITGQPTIPINPGVNSMLSHTAKAVGDSRPFAFGRVQLLHWSLVIMAFLQSTLYKATLRGRRDTLIRTRRRFTRTANCRSSGGTICTPRSDRSG